MQADAQQQALESEAGRRGLILPGQFGVPGPPAVGHRLPRGSAAFAAHHRPHLDEAIGIVRPFADPLLKRTAVGLWEPATCRWLG